MKSTGIDECVLQVIMNTYQVDSLHLSVLVGLILKCAFVFLGLLQTTLLLFIYQLSLIVEGKLVENAFFSRFYC